MFCGNCWYESSTAATFCEKCGRRFPHGSRWSPRGKGEWCFIKHAKTGRQTEIWQAWVGGTVIAETSEFEMYRGRHPRLDLLETGALPQPFTDHWSLAEERRLELVAELQSHGWEVAPYQTYAIVLRKKKKSWLHRFRKQT
jgi:hypothetical protein